MSLDVHRLNELLAQPESEHLEFKKATNTFHLDDVYSYTVALANELGGKLILGVDDTVPRKVVGTRAFAGELEKLKQQILQKVQVRVDVVELQHPLGRVVVFDVPARPRGRPVHVEGRYLMRSGESLVAMGIDQIQAILNEGGPDYSAEICRSATWDDLDTEAIDEFRRRWLKKSGNSALKDVNRVQLLADAELAFGEQITYAALILFGKRLSLGRLLGQAEVIFEYRANDLTGPAQHRVEFRQGFFSFYDKLWDLIELRNTVQHYQDGLFIWDIKTFNEGAIREAILNAVSHRDYRSGESAFVRQYPERIEITSPGGFPEGVTVENILWKQNPRNRRVADILAKCGLVERSGQGMNRIFESCIRESKGDPDFRNTDKWNVCLTLHGTIQQPEFLRVLEKIGDERLRSFSTEDFIVIQAVYTGTVLSDRLEPVARRLLEEGLIEKVPHSKDNPWILARKLFSAIGKAGVHTRKVGLDRETHKALLLAHTKKTSQQGSPLKELRQVVPYLDRGAVQTLLRELREEEKIHSHGNTNAGLWYPGPMTEGCHRE